MTKLDRAKELIKISDKFAEEGEWSLSDEMIVELHNEGYINWLVEQVQELEKEIEYFRRVSSTALNDILENDETNITNQEIIVQTLDLLEGEE